MTITTKTITTYECDSCQRSIKKEFEAVGSFDLTFKVPDDWEPYYSGGDGRVKLKCPDCLVFAYDMR